MCKSGGEILARDRLERLTVDATVGTVRAPPLLLGHIDLDVRDVEGVHVQALHLHTHGTAPTLRGTQFTKR